MAIDKVQFDRNTFAFSYRELAGLGYDPNFVQDYLDQVKNVQEIATSTDEIIDQVNTNTDDITQAKADIIQNAQDIDTNTTNIGTNTTNIGTNTTNIGTNTTNIGTNATNIGNNTTAIGQVASDLNNHEILDSAHGVTGDNVGTGDYCSLVLGGVVDLAALVADLTQIVTADIGAAPAAYDQTYTQSVTDLTNENKAKVNEIVLKVNEIIAGQKFSGQMSNV